MNAETRPVAPQQIMPRHRHPPVAAQPRTPRHQAGALGLLAMVLLCRVGLAAAPQPELVYATDFEPPVYTVGWTLTGQDDWYSFPEGVTSTSQLLEGAIEGAGVQALLGFAPPESNGVYSCSAYRPLNYDPVGRHRPLVTFRVTMAIMDSQQRPERDSFRWSVYNRDAVRLFSLEFDNRTTDIYLQLDDGKFQFLERTFVPDTLYDLELYMNFASNVWSATLNGELLVNAAPLTTRQSRLDLGDIDAVWIQPEGQVRFGDNYLLFDDYRVMAAAAAPLPCEVQLLGMLPEGNPVLRLAGEPGRPYAIEWSRDFLNWTALVTNTPGDGTFLAEDTSADGSGLRFYRGRAIWP